MEKEIRLYLEKEKEFYDDITFKKLSNQIWEMWALYQIKYKDDIEEGKLKFREKILN